MNLCLIPACHYSFNHIFDRNNSENRIDIDIELKQQQIIRKYYSVNFLLDFKKQFVQNHYFVSFHGVNLEKLLSALVASQL